MNRLLSLGIWVGLIGTAGYGLSRLLKERPHEKAERLAKEKSKLPTSVEILNCPRCGDEVKAFEHYCLGCGAPMDAAHPRPDANAGAQPAG